MDPSDTIGLSRRDIERHIEWELRSPPSDPKALIALFTQCMVSLLDKNNRAIARALAERADTREGGG